VAHMAPRGRIAALKGVLIKHRRGSLYHAWREGKQCKEAMQPRGVYQGSDKGGVCWTHGANATLVRKQCSFEGCTNNPKKGGVCVTHGAVMKRFSHEGCHKQVQKGFMLDSWRKYGR
jgi:hypothetical protein